MESTGNATSPKEQLDAILAKTIPIEAGGAGTVTPRFLSVIKPDRRLSTIDITDERIITDKLAQHAEEILSSSQPGYILVIVDTEPGERIRNALPPPLSGILMGLAFIGHRVIFYNGEMQDLEQIAKDVDIVIVDQRQQKKLHNDFKATVTKCSKHVQFFIHTIPGFQLEEW